METASSEAGGTLASLILLFEELKFARCVFKEKFLRGAGIFFQPR
jgi:hypothetical protein